MEQWHYVVNGRQMGPVGMEILRGMAAAGQLLPGDLIWRQGLSEWIPAGRMVELFPRTPASLAPVAADEGDPDNVGFAYTPPLGRSGAGQSLGYYNAGPRGESYKGKATTALVLGLVGLFCFGIITGPLAIVFGGMALSGMGLTGNQDGRGMAIAGLVMGILDTVAAAGFILLRLS